MTTITKPTKARTKAARRRKSKISLANGDTANSRPTGRDRRHTNQPAEDARTVALAARVRVHGIAADAATSPLCTDAVDRCIMALAKDQAAVAQTWRAIITAQHNFRTRILGQTGYPKGAAIAMVPDRMEADTGHTIDIRTADEKDAAAKRAWALWESAIKALPVPQYIWAIRNALNGGMDGEGGDVWRDGQPTARGRVLVDALVAVGG